MVMMIYELLIYCAMWNASFEPEAYRSHAFQGFPFPEDLDSSGLSSASLIVIGCGFVDSSDDLSGLGCFFDFFFSAFAFRM